MSQSSLKTAFISHVIKATTSLKAAGVIENARTLTYGILLAPFNVVQISEPVVQR